MNEIGIKARLLLMTLIPAGILATAVGAYFSWQHLGDLQQQLLEGSSPPNTCKDQPPRPCWPDSRSGCAALWQAL